MVHLPAPGNFIPPEGRPRPISVGVLVDLELTENAGGHVKCWQRIAEAVAAFPEPADLTVYFLGESERVIRLGANARYVTLPPRVGTRFFRFLSQGAGHTDLANFHPRLARMIQRHDVIQTTDIFAFAQTGRRVAAKRGIPLVMSIHTNLPLFTEIYTAEIVRRMLGDNSISRFVLSNLGIGARSARNMQRRVDDMMRQSDRVIVSNENDWGRASRIVGPGRVSHLRRGIDIERFDSAHRDRNRLLREFGLPKNCPVLLFVGRIDATKNALFAAEAVRDLIADGMEVRFLAVGDGAQRKAIRDLLGPAATLPGPLSQADLSWVYASSDVFVFPSESETIGNVVLEAKASGLPVIVSDHPGTAQFVRRHGEDGYILPTADPAAWRQTLRALLSNPEKRRDIGTAARCETERNGPSWRDVVEQDLLPVWQAVAQRGFAARQSHDAIERGFAAIAGD